MDWQRTDDGRVIGTGVYTRAEIAREDAAGDVWTVRIVAQTAGGRQTRHFARESNGHDSVETAMHEAERIEREDGPGIATQSA